MILFGIAGLLVVGASWCLAGIVLGRAPKEGLDTRLVQLTSGIVAIVASFAIAKFLLPPADCARRVLLSTCAIYFGAGVFNYAGLQAMAAGMQRGPNGVVWGIMQSALIFPFIVGILFFNAALTFPRLAGILSIFAALCCFAAAKDNSNGSGSRPWRFFAFLSLAFIAVQQNLATLPSYFEEARRVSAVVRTLAMALGGFAGAVVNILFDLARAPRKTAAIFRGLPRPRLCLYVLGTQLFSLVCSYTLFYPSMDALAKAGAGSVSYPLMVGSCIVSFTLYAMLALKEKTALVQRVALALCVIGLVALCFQAPETTSPSPVRDCLRRVLFAE